MEFVLFLGMVAVLAFLSQRFGCDSRDDIGTDERRREWRSRLVDSDQGA